MKKYYSIVGAYEFKDKKTQEKKFWVSAILQTKYPVRGTREFFFSEEEFYNLFENSYDEKDYNLGLKGIFLVITEDVSVAEEME